MSRPLFTNNAASALAQAITPTDTILKLTPGTGSYFPQPTIGDYFMLTLVQINNPEVSEIVECIDRVGDTLTVVRGQEGTQPQIFNLSDNVELRITAGSLNLFAIGGGGGGSASGTSVADFTATQGQTVFTLPFSYTQGIDNLAIFINGSKQVVNVNYTESTPTTFTMASGLNVGDVVQAIYNLPLAGGIIDASNVIYNEGSTGAVTRTVEKKLQEWISVADFGAVGDGVANDYTAFQNAVAAIPAEGGILLIPAGTYYLGNTGILISRSNITIVGEGMPRIADNNLSLVGGTILQGPVIIDGNNITVEDLGVDSGTTFVTARNSGNGMDGLVIHNVAQTAINKNTNVKNVTGLAKIATSTADATAAVHAVLLESLQYGSADNVVGCGGWFGVVMKLSDFNIGKVIGRECDNTNVYLKSDSYGPVERVNINSIIATNTNTRGYSAVRIEAGSAQLKTVTIGNIVSQNPTVGTNADTGNCVLITAAGTLPADTISVGNISTRFGSNGISVTGPVYAVTADNASLWNGSGVGFSTGGNVGAVVPIDVTFNSIRAAQFAYGAVSISSPNTKAIFGIVNALETGGAIGATSTINVYNTTAIGQYFGTILNGGTGASLLNGWASPYSQPTGIIARSGMTCGYGRISATSATSDIFLQLSLGTFPANLEFYTSMTGLNASNQITTVGVFVNSSGQASIYPNRAAYSTFSWFNLGDLKFPSQIPVEGGV